jgi:hypothetical protein
MDRADFVTGRGICGGRLLNPCTTGCCEPAAVPCLAFMHPPKLERALHSLRWSRLY